MAAARPSAGAAAAAATAAAATSAAIAAAVAKAIRGENRPHFEARPRKNARWAKAAGVGQETRRFSTKIRECNAAEAVLASIDSLQQNRHLNEHVVGCKQAIYIADYPQGLGFF